MAHALKPICKFLGMRAFAKLADTYIATICFDVDVPILCNIQTSL